MVNVAARIRAVGEPTGRIAKNGVIVCRVKCQGCGGDIASDEELTGVEYVKTKRGSEWFFHTSCANKVWRRKIL